MLVDKRKLFALFALALLLVSLLLVNLNAPTTASGSDGTPIYLHGPPLTPIHMNHNESLEPVHMHSNITLTPIHMHHKDGLLQWGDDRLYNPVCTDWEELYPNNGTQWHLASWNDTYDDDMLSQNDQIDMNTTLPDGITNRTEWFHVDRMTVTLLLSPLPGPPLPPPAPWPEPAEPTIAIELKWPTYFPDIKYLDNLPPNLNTTWHQVWPSINYSNVYNLTSWLEDPFGPTFKLDPCDVVDLTDNITGVVRTTWWHVEDVATDLILRWKMVDPLCTWWHELYPDYSKVYHLTSWNDTQEEWELGYDIFSSCDQIDMDSDDWKWDIFWSMGDVNRDGYIDQTDLDLIALHFCTGDPQYDINKDGHVDLTDSNICTSNQGLEIWTYFPNLGVKEWYHVDRITITINVTWDDNWMMLELKTYNATDPEEMYHALKSPWETLWHEVYPRYSNVYNLTHWNPMVDDNCNGVLDPCDDIWLLNMSSEVTVEPEVYHIVDMSYDIILNKKIADPVCTDWHEIFPEFSNYHHVTNWTDNGDEHLSPCDQIEMKNLTALGQPTDWYHVDRVTLTLKLYNETYDPDTRKIEFKGPFEEMYKVKTEPEWSYWHEVWPWYSEVYEIIEWKDNCNGVLDHCDNITLYNGFEFTMWHVEGLYIDIILNKKMTDPVCTDWQELRPDFDNWYHVEGWEDNHDGVLSPCDQVNLTLQPGGQTKEYHVENVTLTLNVTETDPPYDWMIIELDDGFENMYEAKTDPEGTRWHAVYPPSVFCNYYDLLYWEDDCNGVLSHCDVIELVGIFYHVEEVAIDMIVKEKLPPTPPPPLYWKENYTDYAPSGVPDFDQRQDLWNASPRGFTWCTPTAVANSLSWMDSRYETSTTPPPTVNNTFNLVSNYTPGIDDHDPQNVQPFIEHLAYLMDTDGNRTNNILTAHDGTLVPDMKAGIAQYLSWTGVNPLGDVNGDGRVNQTDYNIVLWANNTTPGAPNWTIAADIWPVTLGHPARGVADNLVNQSDLDLVSANMNQNGTFYVKTVRNPDFYFVEDEVKRCEDVILLLHFYSGDPSWNPTTDPLLELGHAVTVAGVNSTSWPRLVAISDPGIDNAEPPPQGTSGPGRVIPPPPHPHNATPPHTLHNNASYVSHDIYNVTFIAPPPHISNATWALQNMRMPVATVEWAVILSPLPPVGVCGVNITDVKLFKVVQGVSHAVSQGYQTWAPGKIFVNVTVHNNGTLTTNCTVNVYYYNVTAHLIGTQNLTDYDPCNTTTLTFAWDVSTVPRGIYTIKANATCTCGVSDEFIDGTMKIKKVGDVTGNDVVDIFDLSATALATVGYYQQCDFDLDGDVDIFDLSAVALATAGG